MDLFRQSFRLSRKLFSYGGLPHYLLLYPQYPLCLTCQTGHHELYFLTVNDHPCCYTTAYDPSNCAATSFRNRPMDCDLDLLTLGEAAKLLKVSVVTLRRWINRAG